MWRCAKSTFSSPDLKLRKEREKVAAALFKKRLLNTEFRRLRSVLAIEGFNLLSSDLKGPQQNRSWYFTEVS